LCKQGFRVFGLHGIFLRPEDKQDDEQAAHTAAGMRERLAYACARIGAPLHTVDLTESFSDLVIRPFVHSYALGLTPNPCALCNARVKFGLLLDAALSLGAERLATGHYARIEERSGLFPPALFQGRDPGKDQSYFLALTPQNALAKALFPLGDATKAEVLAALAECGLSAPQPGESQEVCFVPGDEYREFIPRMAARFGIALSGPGPMLLRDGRRVGTHKGLWQYTEGQRKGLGVGWKAPLHVLGKERADNILRLGAKHDLCLDGIICDDVNVLLPPACWPETVLVKTRYREQLRQAKARFAPAADGSGRQEMHIRFAEPENAVAPGQIAAVYLPGHASEQKDGASGEPGGLRLAAGGIIRQHS
jgi:tRNA-specific 2-thiouridylase